MCRDSGTLLVHVNMMRNVNMVGNDGINLTVVNCFLGHSFAFSVLTLLVGRREEHPACKN